MTQTDRLGRATFRHIAPQRDVTPTTRELRWLTHIDRHGPQSSQYLYELTRDTHRCKDTALRQMQRLRAGGYLALPPQQRLTANAEFNPYIYDLTKAARDYMRAQGLAEPTIRPQGHWWHSYGVSSITSAIDIAAARKGVRYIPTHDILAIRNATLAIPIGRQRLIPDQLFALDYGGSFRVFALEVDRGTEPMTSAAARKSLASSIELYDTLVARQIWKSHYGLKANLLVLWVFANRNRENRFHELVSSTAEAAAPATLTAAVPDLARGPIRWDRNCSLFEAPWRRPSGKSVRISAA